MDVSWIIVLICIRVTFCAGSLAPIQHTGQYNYLLGPLENHFRSTNLPVNFCLEDDVRIPSSSAQLDTINALLQWHNDWMVVTVHYATQCGQILFFQNVFLAATYHSLEAMVSTMNYYCYDASGYYMISVADDNLNESSIVRVFGMLWKLRIVNVVFVAPSQGGHYRAYSYDPYERDNCGIIRLRLIDRYVNGRWLLPTGWFRDAMQNFHGCPLKVGTFEAQPFSMARQKGGKTVFVGLEVDIMEAIATRLNFSCEFVSPAGKTKWGRLLPTNSTGLMGMIQRGEVDFGFGAIGHSPLRNNLLRSSYPGIITQMTMAIPPKKPYSSLEKLFQPFTASAWTLIVVCYSIVCALSAIVVYFKRNPLFEQIPRTFYTLWTILMGGPGIDVRRHSSRIYVTSLLLNAFVVRNLYQSALFQYLKSTEVTAANLNSYDDINAAGLYYYMYSPTSLFFLDNPWVNKRIRILNDDDLKWDKVLYNISQHQLDGVLTLPLESISYYVKHHGQKGMVYVGEDTGIAFYIGFHFPRTSALKDPFDRLLHRFYAGGFIVHWKRSFRDNPDTWVNREKDNIPTPLHLQQVSGGFYLWAALMLLAAVVFAVELALSNI